VDLLSDVALRKLVNVLGAQRARLLVAEILAEIGLGALNTPDDRLQFSLALIKRGGLVEAIGRAIKIQAILHGARDPDLPTTPTSGVRSQVKSA
jgi:hypothetical protein